MISLFLWERGGRPFREKPFAKLFEKLAIRKFPWKLFYGQLSLHFKTRLSARLRFADSSLRYSFLFFLVRASNYLHLNYRFGVVNSAKNYGLDGWRRCDAHYCKWFGARAPSTFLSAKKKKERKHQRVFNMIHTDSDLLSWWRIVGTILDGYVELFAGATVEAHSGSWNSGLEKNARLLYLAKHTSAVHRSQGAVRLCRRGVLLFK